MSDRSDASGREPNKPSDGEVANDWDRVSVSVRRIANGFLVQEKKSDAHKVTYGDELFYPSIEAVEAELLFRLKAAIALDMSGAGQDF